MMGEISMFDEFSMALVVEEVVSDVGAEVFAA
jgi:hypothetical protein